MSRRNILILVAVASVAAAALGWILGQQIRSPAEIAASTAPPEPSLITVPVERRELSSRVVARATLASSEETPIEVSASTEGTPIVTAMPNEVGDELDEGQLAIEIAGRPMIALQGELPVYRTIGPGISPGPDITQLEQALVRLGYDPGTVDDEYTSATGSAVAALYRDLGYTPDGRTLDEQDTVDMAQDRVDELQRQLNEATGSSGSSGVPDSVRLQKDLEVTQAERDAAAARSARDEAMATAAERVSSARTSVGQATTTRDEAAARLGTAQGGTHPDTGEPPTAEELAELEVAVSDAEAALAMASAELQEAEVDQPKVKAEQDALVSDAEARVAIAKADRDETFASSTSGSGGDSSGGSGASPADLRRQLADAREELAQAQATTGVSFPAGELVFVPTLPRTVQSMTVELGRVASGTVMTVTGVSTTLEGTVTESDHALLSEGLEVIVEDDDLGISTTATITFLAENPADDRYPYRLTPSEDLPTEALGESLRVTIPISSTGGEVLAVPLAAVSAGPSGDSRVEVLEADGSTRLVEVSIGLAADGFVEITARGGEIDENDRVVVGRDLVLPGAESDDSGDDDSEGDGDGNGNDDSEGDG